VANRRKSEMSKYKDLTRTLSRALIDPTKHAFDSKIEIETIVDNSVTGGKQSSNGSHNTSALTLR
jgi:hypothetical protein